MVTLHSVHGKPLLTGRRSLSSLAAHLGAKQPSQRANHANPLEITDSTPLILPYGFPASYRIDGIVCFLGLYPAPRAVIPHEPSKTGGIRGRFPPVSRF